MKERAVEKFYSAPETALLLGYSGKWVRQNIEQFARFGRVVKIDDDYRIAASAINGFLDAFTLAAVQEAGVFARSDGELRRKVRSRSGAL